MSYGFDLELVNKYVGKTITFACVNDEKVTLKFGDDGLCVWDNASYCCEHRYITTDDDVSDLVRGKLRHIVVREGPAVEDAYFWGCHDIAFLEIATDQTHVTFETHNEHNGYYGGFEIMVEEV